ncbi:hypothetical protein [uncultured Chloroflexus sp.]|uniref:hypothetical protein n=1 Tax=uncultured Chloroflexus sp. TaxID=214040 RepID=UPI002629AE4E|nr:hypothetical protein [uncultured Chloroflexus sp.]
MLEPDNDARVLVVIVPRPRDLELARSAGWYRLPLSYAPPRLAADYLAFYQPGSFGAERWRVQRYAAVLRYHIVQRRDLLPDEPNHPRASERYYRIDLGPLCELERPVLAARLRRITFIATTFGRLRQAIDVTDLFMPPPPPDVWGGGLAGKAIT